MEKTMLNVKCGRYELELSADDEVMYNGNCYQVITQRVGNGWNQSIPIIAKAKAVKLIKDGILLLNRKETRSYVNVEIYKIG